MSEKTNLLGNMNREQLIKVVGAEQARLNARGIEIDSSPDDDTLRSYLVIKFHSFFNYHPSFINDSPPC